MIKYNKTYDVYVTEDGRVYRRAYETHNQSSKHVKVIIQHGKRPYLHRIVLETFCGPCPSDYEGHHRDENPKNNSLANLEWKRIGGHRRLHHCRKLHTHLLYDEEIWLVHKLIKSKVKARLIAQMFKMSTAWVQLQKRKIKERSYRETWANVLNF